MDTVHANVAEIEELRSLLVSGGATVQEVRQTLREFLGRMWEGWKDQEYERFADTFLSTEAALEGFVESSEIYGRYLRRLVLHLEEYLSTTLRSDSAASGAAFRMSADWHRDLVRRDVQKAVEILGPIVTELHSHWHSLSPTERLEKLRGLQITLAASQARKSAGIVSARLEYSVFGAYDAQGIRVNQDHLANPDRFWQLLDTIIHEDRHAYQKWSIETPGFHGDTGQVRAWAENWENYLDPREVSFRRYRAQPLENDAFWFAESVVLGIIGRRHVG